MEGRWVSSRWVGIREKEIGKTGEEESIEDEREERSRIRTYRDNERKFIVCARLVRVDHLRVLGYERMENV